MPEIFLENSAWWLVPIALASFLLAWLLYFKGRAFTTGQRKVLFGLRFVIFFLLGLLLLSPLFKITEREEQKPILVWLEDHSTSMLAQDDSAAVKEFLQQNEGAGGLDDKYDLRFYDFSDQLMEAGDSFSAKSTDLNEALRQVQELFYNQNVGAVVLLSDGISNQGNNPGYTAEALPFPVYSLGFGDTTVPRDLFIDRVVHNEVSYLNNDFPVEVYLRARELSGEDFTLRVNNSTGRQVYRESLAITDEDYFHRTDFFLKAEAPGLQRYTVSVSTLSGEENTRNNTASFTIEVVSNRKKVAVIGIGPHPDMGAIARALRGVEKYEVNTFIETDLSGNDLEADLFILHNPSAALLQRFATKENSFWIIQGSETPPAALQKFTGLSTGSKGFEETALRLAGGFDLFKLTEEEREWTASLPPLWSPFGRPEISDRFYPLFYKNVGTVETQDPLWFFIPVREGARLQKKAFTLGTGLWRWRMDDYRQHRSHALFDGLISKTVQYLTTGQQDKRFDVDLPTRFNVAERLTADARLYNRSLELTNAPEVEITFVDDEGKAYPFSFARSQKTYRLSAGQLPAGLYRWKATTELGDENFEQTGSVLIEENRLEETDLVARHDVLRRLSNASGGKFYKQNKGPALRQALLANPEAKSFQVLQSTTGSIIDKRWVFAIFLILLALEWGLRKYFGNY